MPHPLSIKNRLVGWIAWRLRPAWLASAFKRAMRITPIEIELPTHKMIVDPVSHLGMQLLTHGGYEPDLTDFLEQTLKTGDIFVDVGANEGYFSFLAASKVGMLGRVIAIEPQRRLQARFAQNVALNEARQIEYFSVAIGDHHGTETLHLTPDMNSGASGLEQVTRYACQTETVSLMTLSELWGVAKLEKVSLMKMDIEGFEYEAILGSPEIFREHRVKTLAVELHPNLIRGRGLDPERIVDFLCQHGYRRIEYRSLDVFSVV